MVNEVNLSPKFLSNQVKYVQHPPHHQAPPLSGGAASKEEGVTEIL